MTRFFYPLFAVLGIVLVLKLSAAGRHYIEMKRYHNTGLRYADAEDYTKAAFWFRKAAEQGFAESQYRLAILYENGDGVLKDYYIQAVYWYLAAARKGHQGAQKALEGTPSSAMMIAERAFAMQAAEQARPEA